MSSDLKNEAPSWEGADGHRFALEVLQHPLRRKMLCLIAGSMKDSDLIAKDLDLGEALAKYHLQMLEKALVIEQTEGGWIVTPTGRLYLKYVEAKI